MTDLTPEQLAELTEAAAWLDSYQAADTAEAWATLRKYLPPEVTNPKPVLPTEPGLYVDARGQAGPVWRVEVDGTSGQVGGYGKPEKAPQPFTRLVQERPKVTADQVRHIVGTGTLLPSEINQLVALANGETE